MLQSSSGCGLVAVQSVDSVQCMHVHLFLILLIVK